MWDELDEPLGLVENAATTRPPARKSRTKGAAIWAAVFITAIALVTLSRRDFPVDRGPSAVARLEAPPTPKKVEAPDVTASVKQTAPPPAEAATQVQVTSGVKVIGSGGPSKPLIIDVAQALAARSTPGQESRPPEKSRDGLLPRIAR